MKIENNGIEGDLTASELLTLYMITLSPFVMLVLILYGALTR